MEDYIVSCELSTEGSSQSHSLQLLNLSATFLPAVSSTIVQPDHCTVSPAPSGTAKRYFFKVLHSKVDQCSGFYDGPILCTVKRNFIQKCDAFESPDVHRLSVMQFDLHN